MTNRDKLRKFFSEELDIKDVENFDVFNKHKAGMSTGCEGFTCPENTRLIEDRCSVCEYHNFWNKSLDVKVSDIVNSLNALKYNHPDTEVIMETPEGTLTCKLSDALIYDSPDGKLVIDSE